jgi:hypothetical protein
VSYNEYRRNGKYLEDAVFSAYIEVFGNIITRGVDTYIAYLILYLADLGYAAVNNDLNVKILNSGFKEVFYSVATVGKRKSVIYLGLTRGAYGYLSLADCENTVFGINDIVMRYVASARIGDRYTAKINRGNAASDLGEDLVCSCADTMTVG